MSLLDQFKNIFYKKFDFLLFIPILILCIFSTLSLYNYNSQSLFEKQLIWVILGVSLFLIIFRLNLSFLQNSKLVIIIYAFANALLLYTVFFGATINGAKAWINLGLFSFQPADLAKLAIILLLAKYFSKRHMEIQFLRHIVVSLIYTLIPVGLIMLQPDFGSAMVIMFIWFFVVFMSGLSKKHLFIMFMLGLAGVFLMWNFVFAEYQKNRVLNFINPVRDIRGSGYNVYQALIAIGSGGTFGKGVGLGTQSKFNFLPEYQTDFIFSAYAEEWGFVGVIILFIIYFVLLSRLMYLAYFTSDNFSSILTIGVFAWVFVHVFINISMNLGLFPVTGIPLPFMSYGGSHIVLMALAVAVVSSVTKVNYKNKISSDFSIY